MIISVPRKRGSNSIRMVKSKVWLLEPWEYTRRKFLLLPECDLEGISSRSALISSPVH